MSKVKNEFGYLGNPNVKRDGIESEFTKEEIVEYQKCMMDPAHFARKHLKVISLDEGLVPFDLYPYQEKMFHQYEFFLFGHQGMSPPTPHLKFLGRKNL